MYIIIIEECRSYACLKFVGTSTCEYKRYDKRKNALHYIEQCA